MERTDILVFDSVDKYRSFYHSASQIISEYGFISYLDILDLIGQEGTRCDSEITWTSTDDWIKEYWGHGEWRVHLRGTKPRVAYGKLCGPIEFEGNWSPASFFNYIVRNNQRDSWYTYTYIIMGKGGPTGKTRLRDMLEDKGFKAFEISEDLTGSNLVEYRDDENHYLVNDLNKTITIVLNKRLW